jgi:hypothetical protein
LDYFLAQVVTVGVCHQKRDWDFGCLLLVYVLTTLAVAISASRDYWKNRAKIAEEKLHKVNIETGSEKKEIATSDLVNLSTSDPRGELAAKGHHYSVKAIQISVQQVIDCGSSYRGVEKTFELYKEIFSQAIRALVLLENG